MVLGFPWVSGTAVLIYYAGLIGISDSVLDAARLDGVTGLQRIRRIDIPLIRGQIKFFLVVGIIDSMKGYEINLVLTNGGPGYSTMVPGLHMYQEAFAYQRMGLRQRHRRGAVRPDPDPDDRQRPLHQERSGGVR